MHNRLVAIGDIHGHARALESILQLINLRPEDTLVTLGDYIDRGPDSKSVLDILIGLEKLCNLVPLMGNHEEMMLGAWEGKDNLAYWLKFGGGAALDSYGPGRNMSLVPWSHWDFLKRLRPWYETERHFFVHANYQPDRPLDKQDTSTLLWELLDKDKPSKPHCLGKIAVVGHTPQKYGRILDLGHIVCIDTNCGEGGLLTALDVGSGQIWQVTEEGKGE